MALRDEDKECSGWFLQEYLQGYDIEISFFARNEEFHSLAEEIAANLRQSQLNYVFGDPMPELDFLFV